MFKAEKFDPEEWADLFQKAGAKFAGPVAEHHDGFSMWASQVTPWNAKDMGPKRDILGDLFAALEEREMKTIATFHHARNLQRYADSWETESKRKGRKFNNSHYPYIPGGFTASDDPQLRLLYGNVPAKEWYEKVWLGKLQEVIDKYHPDIIWFDSWLDRVPETYRQKFAAYYLNAAEKCDAGQRCGEQGLFNRWHTRRLDAIRSGVAVNCPCRKRNQCAPLQNSAKINPPTIGTFLGRLSEHWIK